MTTTKDENGIINNFAKEPKVYVAENPTPKEQRRYAITGAISGLLIAGFIAASFAIS
ncbi:photosystem II assembly protein Psb34 [Myxosarcina sp. GI1]|uniref:photosystem II assembly protein Psb34 n=1 Tax=Myxosarcina sp. GI1 TaxID=1541065 RepID=UPI00055C025E|nr:ssl1498 family light-harvesting-like protein [Myxosarcina sp. GI1]